MFGETGIEQTCNLKQDIPSDMIDLVLAASTISVYLASTDL